jgi:hypothetical protein
MFQFSLTNGWIIRANIVKCWLGCEKRKDKMEKLKTLFIKKK